MGEIGYAVAIGFVAIASFLAGMFFGVHLQMSHGGDNGS